MSKREQAFVIAAIEIKAVQDKKDKAKIKSKHK
nr:MAG TPA: hypothetical protein [Caudoviricetes sp.]